MKPIKKLPTKLTVSVEYGKVSFGIILFNRNLNAEPTPPPINTSRKSFIYLNKLLYVAIIDIKTMKIIKIT